MFNYDILYTFECIPLGNSREKSKNQVRQNDTLFVENMIFFPSLS